MRLYGIIKNAIIKPPKIDKYNGEVYVAKNIKEKNGFYEYEYIAYTNDEYDALQKEKFEEKFRTVNNAVLDQYNKISENEITISELKEIKATMLDLYNTLSSADNEDNEDNEETKDK